MQTFGIEQLRTNTVHYLAIRVGRLQGWFRFVCLLFPPPFVPSSPPVITLAEMVNGTLIMPTEGQPVLTACPACCREAVKGPLPIQPPFGQLPPVSQACIEGHQKWHGIPTAASGLHDGRGQPAIAERAPSYQLHACPHASGQQRPPRYRAGTGSGGAQASSGLWCRAAASGA